MNLAPELRRFGPIGVLAIILILATGNIVGAALVVVWATVAQVPWRDLGFVRSPNLAADIILGALAGIFLKIFLKAAILPLLGVPAMNASYHYLAGNASALPAIIAFVIIGGGFGEELIWRGFLFERMKALLGASARARIVTVTLTTVLFALAHLADQGWPGAVQATFTGLAFGIAYARIGRLWPVMAAHAAFDVTAILMIYWNLETPIAHLIWR